MTNKQFNTLISVLTTGFDAIAIILSDPNQEKTRKELENIYEEILATLEPE